jgi:hypothetical protein
VICAPQAPQSAASRRAACLTERASVQINTTLKDTAGLALRRLILRSRVYIMRKSFLLIAVLLTAGDCLLTAEEIKFGVEMLLPLRVSFTPDTDEEGTKIDSGVRFPGIGVSAYYRIIKRLSFGTSLTFSFLFLDLLGGPRAYYLSDMDFSLYADLWFKYINLRLLFTFGGSFPASNGDRDDEFDRYIERYFFYRKAAGAEVIIKRPIEDVFLFGIGYEYVLPGDTIVIKYHDDRGKHNLMSKDGFSRVTITLHWSSIAAMED